MIRRNRFMIKLAKLFRNKDQFSGPIMCFRSKYGSTAKDYKQILEDRIRLIRTQIISKTEISREERLLVLSIPHEEEKLYEDIKKYFSEKGFITFYADKNNIEELKERRYLFISWDIN